MILSSRNKTGVVGVYYNDRKQQYEAQIKRNGKSIYLGRFIRIAAAQRARAAAEIKYGPVRKVGGRCKK